MPLACGILYSISQLQSNHAFKIGRLVEENFDDVDKFKDDGSTEEIYKDIKSEVRYFPNKIAPLFNFCTFIQNPFVLSYNGSVASIL